MLYYYFQSKNVFSWLSFDLTTNKFSTDIVRPLSKRNRFSIGGCAKFVGHVRCPTVTSHPDYCTCDCTFVCDCMLMYICLRIVIPTVAVVSWEAWGVYSMASTWSHGIEYTEYCRHNLKYSLVPTQKCFSK